MANAQNLKPFTKGDPRINRRGRPPKSDLIAQLAQSLLEEPVEFGSEHQTVTRLETILREWLDSGNFQKKLAVIQYAYGRIPNEAAAEDRDIRIVVNWGNTVNSPVDYLASEDPSGIIDVN